MRYDPFETMERLFDQMRRDMVTWRESAGELQPFVTRPEFGFDINADLAERDGEFVFTADLPGFERKEIDLRFDDGDLVLSATHDEGDETSSRRRSIAERVSLSKPVAEDEISASYRNGVLEVHLPIVEGAVERGHRIDID